MNADERIIALVDPELMERVPSFVCKHATTSSCKLIAREHPELYAEFSREGGPSDAAVRQMRQIVNSIFIERMRKHCM